jgi:putative redox protein
MPASKARLTDGYQVQITSRHHTYFADEPISDGGTDTMVSPTEMLMGALGACIALTCKMYAQRKGWNVTAVEVDLDFTRFNSKDYPDYEGEAQFVHEIRESIRFEGDLDDEQRERLLDIASKCPVSRVIELPSFFKRTLAELE